MQVSTKLTMKKNKKSSKNNAKNQPDNEARISDNKTIGDDLRDIPLENYSSLFGPAPTFNSTAQNLHTIAERRGADIKNVSKVEAHKQRKKHIKKITYKPLVICVVGLLVVVDIMAIVLHLSGFWEQKPGGNMLSL